MTERRTKRREPAVENRVLSDPRAIRALAHPARLTVLEVLSGNDQLTATALAEIAEITPSAMSYHLRALEKWGFVERAASADARERPWRRIGSGFNIETLPDAATVAATTALTTMELERGAADLMRWFAREREQPEAWRHAATMENRIAWLTADEAEQLRELLDAFLADRADRSTEQHPDGARRVRLMRVLAPLQLD